VRGARAELAELFRTGACPRWLAVYLGDECFVDLRGLGLLIELAERELCRGGELLVVAPPHGLRRMVELLGIGSALRMVDTVPDALRWLRSRTAG
jgi:ABC-type transporter Mla MlaB component